MFCNKCGATLEEGNNTCPCCGAENIVNNKNDDGISSGFFFLSLLFPIVGFILFYVFKNQKPLRAESCSEGGFLGLGIWFLLFLFIVLFVLANIAKCTGSI